MFFYILDELGSAKFQYKTLFCLFTVNAVDGENVKCCCLITMHNRTNYIFKYFNFIKLTLNYYRRSIRPTDEIHILQHKNAQIYIHRGTFVGVEHQYISI